MSQDLADVRIVATGLYTPPHSISNDELVAAFNAYVEDFNSKNAAAIAAGDMEPLHPSSSEFIEKASGIKARYVIEKDGILDIARMAPKVAPRANEELSILAEMAVAAAPSPCLLQMLCGMNHLSDQASISVRSP